MRRMADYKELKAAGAITLEKIPAGVQVVQPALFDSNGKQVQAEKTAPVPERHVMHITTYNPITGVASTETHEVENQVVDQVIEQFGEQKRTIDKELAAWKLLKTDLETAATS